MASNENFPAIGNLAERTDALDKGTEEENAVADEERPLQEIESLCMVCEEQVGTIISLYGVKNRSLRRSRE